ncbi:MAG: cytochrome C biosynthesis protein [Actinomycetota bacterium]|nr:cytochrome C biosynthesis protein [Actinomycetota bacterium]
MSSGREELVERRDQALRDLADLARQQADGEIDPGTAGRLRARYEAEAASTLEELTLVEAGSHQPEAPKPQQVSRPRWRRQLAGALVGVVGVTAAGLLLPRYISDRPAGGFVTGNQVAGEGGRDLSSVTNDELEEVVAANPEVLGMRLALAQRYLVDRQYGKALDHYRVVLDREPHPQALAAVGWILFQTSDEVDAAEQFVMESLAKAPGDRLALWFLANIRLYGTNDPDAAATVARQLLARDDLSAEEREAIQALLDQAKAAAAEERR